MNGTGTMTITTQAGPDSNDMVLDHLSFAPRSTRATSSIFANAGAGHQLVPIAVPNASRDVGPYGQGYNPDSDPNILRHRVLESQQAPQTQAHTSPTGSRIQSSDSNHQGLQNSSNQSHVVPGTNVQRMSSPFVPPRGSPLLPTPNQNHQCLQSPPSIQNSQGLQSQPTALNTLQQVQISIPISALSSNTAQLS